jgi:hypothetical protein
LQELLLGFARAVVEASVWYGLVISIFILRSGHVKLTQ